MIRLRVFASALAVTLVAAACSRGSDGAASPTSSPQRAAVLASGETPRPSNGASGGGRATPRPGRATQPSGKPGSGGGSGGGGGDSGPASSDDAGDVGANSLAYLRSSPSKLVVEVDAVQGFEPSAGVLDHLKSVLEGVVSKPDGVEVLPVRTIQSSTQDYTTQSLVAVEAANRQTHTRGNTASLYILFLNGDYQSIDSKVLGLSYEASAFAVFEAQVRQATTALISSAPIERAVTVHETGHLLRLVNIGYHSPRDHEDPANPNHSKNKNSVMYWAVEDVRVASLLSGGPPDTYDGDDLADLADLKAGRL